MLALFSRQLRMKPPTSLSSESQPSSGATRDSNLRQKPDGGECSPRFLLIFKVDISADLGGLKVKMILEGIGTVLISDLLYLDRWLGRVCPIAFPNHCILSVFDLHDEQMISFS